MLITARNRAHSRSRRRASSTTRDFSFRSTEGEASRPASAVISTCLRCHLDLPPLSSRTASTVIATCLRCHRDLPPLSSRPQGEISAEPDLIGKTRFLASPRNDSGESITAFALAGTRRLLAPPRNFNSISSSIFTCRSTPSPAIDLPEETAAAATKTRPERSTLRQPDKRRRSSPLPRRYNRQGPGRWSGRRQRRR